MLYKILSARSPHHDQEITARIRLLYEGGYAAKAGLRRLLSRAPNEPQSSFEYRSKQASYMPYFGQLVDYIVGALFQNPLHVTPAGDANDPDTIGELPDKDFYPLFARDCDRKGTPFSQLIRDAVTEALLCHCAWIAVDMPRAVEASNRREEDEYGGSRGYACLVPFEEIYDWCEDDDGDGDLAWAIIGRRCSDRKNPNAGRDTYYERFTLWEKDPSTGVVSYKCFETAPVKIGDRPKENEEVPLVDEGVTTFECIPLVRMELPPGLWAGNKIGPLAEEHYRRRADMVGAMARSMFEIPYVKQGPEVPAPNEGLSEAQSNPGRGNDPVSQFKQKGFIVLGSGDDIGFAGPSGKAYEITDRQLTDLRDEIFRSVHAMSLAIATSGVQARRSAESKVEDRRATGVVLDYLGSKARELAVNVYRTISDARGEEVVWAAHGLDDYDLEDTSDVVKDATLVQSITIPSPTFKTEYFTKVALGLLPGASPETKSQIQREISESIEAEGEEAEEAEESESMPPLTGQEPDGDGDEDEDADEGAGVPAGVAPGQPGMGQASQQKPVSGNPGAAQTQSSAVPIHQRNSSTAGVAETVYQQLLEDFPPEALEWVRAALWEGPLDVPLESIDFSNRESWTATHDQEHVDDFVEKAEDGEVKPAILVNEPNNEKLIVIDGHHRTLAAEKAGVPVLAYVAHVNTVTGPWDTMHASQSHGVSLETPSRTTQSRAPSKTIPSRTTTGRTTPSRKY